MPLLNVSGLTKQFGGLTAVDNVDFTINRGEIVGLIGPNGAGKTTFVDLLTGGAVPTAGKIEYDGRNITRMANHDRCRLGLARTYQIPQPFGRSTVLENVTVGALFGSSGRKLSIAQARIKAAETLEAVGLSGSMDAFPSALTTAGLKRLELARCLATAPTLVFLDEPLGGLNSTEVKDALALIRKVRDSGVTILFIEHIVPAVLALSDRVMVLANGRKLAEGSGAEVTQDPKVQKAYLGDLSATASRFARRRRPPVTAGATVETMPGEGNPVVGATATPSMTVQRETGQP
ncbi:MAG: high-affinity branched-chain amino acid transporter ATPase [Paucimonas sp.]|nr:high-affinity branched-chain amino acid transporter ATPase [Paucimonas sp.]